MSADDTKPEGRTDSALVLLYPGAILQEVMLTATLLADAGYRVEHTAPTPDPHRDSSGLRVLPDLPYSAVDPSGYRCLLVPGGDPGSIMEDTEVDRIVRGAVEAGALAAGICAGNLVLAKTGVLRGRRIVHNYRAPWAPPEVESFVAAHWEGAEVEPDPSCLLAQDANLITALPNGHLDFALAVTRALEVHSERQAAFLARYYRGLAGPAEAPSGD